MNLLCCTITYNGISYFPTPEIIFTENILPRTYRVKLCFRDCAKFRMSEIPIKRKDTISLNLTEYLLAKGNHEEKLKRIRIHINTSIFLEYLRVHCKISMAIFGTFFSFFDIKALSPPCIPTKRNFFWIN
jgi:hypothetical protein